MSLGAKLIASLVDSGDVGAYVRSGLTEELFLPSERDLFLAVDQHIGQYGSYPSEVALQKCMGGAFDGYVDFGDTPKYYIDQLMDRHVYKGLQAAMQDAAKVLNANQPPLEALNLMCDRITDLLMRKEPGKLMDFRAAKALLLKHYSQVYHEDEASAAVKFGWPTLDTMSTGLWPGDFVAYIGRPAMGKTMFMLFTALHAWAVQNKPVLFVSMEMAPLVIMQRLAALHLSLPMTHLMHSALNTLHFKKMAQGLEDVSKSETPFWVLDGNLTSTVKDIFQYARQLDPAVIYIDGAYLLEHPNPRLNEYSRVSENAKLLKGQVAGQVGIPVIGSYQFNREADKKLKNKKMGEEPGLSDIAYSDAIGQLGSIVLGLLEPESVETIESRKISILKGRYGEVGSFKVNWDFLTMNFTEIPKHLDLELQYL